MLLHAHKQSSAHAKEHMLNHHWSFPGNKKSLRGLNPSSWTLAKCRVQLLQGEKKKSKSLSSRERERGEESEVEGSGAVILGKKGVTLRGRQTDKRTKPSAEEERKGPTNWQREVRVSLLCISFTWLAVSTNRIGSGARGLGRRIKTPNAFTALIPLSHNTLSALLFSLSLSFLSSLS